MLLKVSGGPPDAIQKQNTKCGIEGSKGGRQRSTQMCHDPDGRGADGEKVMVLYRNVSHQMPRGHSIK